jgi:hypothetical protein
MLKYRIVYLENLVRKVVDVECANFMDVTYTLTTKSIWISNIVILSVVLINTESCLEN